MWFSLPWFGMAALPVLDFSARPSWFPVSQGTERGGHQRHPPLQVSAICKHCLCSVELFPHSHILVPDQFPGASRDRWLILTQHLKCLRWCLYQMLDRSDHSFLLLWSSPLMSVSPLDHRLSTLISFSFLYSLDLFPRSSLMLLESFTRTAWGVFTCGSPLSVKKETSSLSNEDTYQLRGLVSPSLVFDNTWDLPPQTPLFYFQAPTIRTQ